MLCYKNWSSQSNSRFKNNGFSFENKVILKWGRFFMVRSPAEIIKQGVLCFICDIYFFPKSSLSWV